MITCRERIGYITLVLSVSVLLCTIVIYSQINHLANYLDPYADRNTARVGVAMLCGISWLSGALPTLIVFYRKPPKLAWTSLGYAIIVATMHLVSSLLVLPATVFFSSYVAVVGPFIGWSIGVAWSIGIMVGTMLCTTR